MSKKIKIINCPQCGSVHKTQIKENQFRCNSCNTEYFLDSDDVNINVLHKYDTPQSANANKQPKLNKQYWLFGALIALTLLIYFISLFLKSKNIENYIAAQETKYEYFVHNSRGMEVNGKPYIFCLGLRRNYANGVYNAENKRFVYLFYNINDDKVENVTEIETETEYTDSDIGRFADGKYYLTLNKKHIYRIDTDKMMLENITQKICDANENLITGIVSASLYANYFTVKNNIGDDYVYYPAIDRVYSIQESRQQHVNISAMLFKDIEVDTVKFAFTESSPTKLIKASLNPATNKTTQKELSPGRRFFAPYIVYQDNNHLLVGVRVNAGDDAPIEIQKLDTQTGDVIWSTPVRTPDRYHHIFNSYNETVLANNTFIIKDEYRVYTTLSMDGIYHEMNWTRGSIVPKKSNTNDGKKN